jgi:uncharacterized protein YvpB
MESFRLARGAFRRRTGTGDRDRVATNRSLVWAQFARTSALWALRQVLGVLTIVGSVALVVGVASLAQMMAARWGWDAIATALGLLGWLGASAAALYALTRFLRLQRQRTVSLWLLLTGVYLAVMWAAGGLPLAPRLPELGAPPASAAERPLVMGGGLPSAQLPPLPATATPTRAPLASATAPRPTAVAAPTAPPLPLWGQTEDSATLWSSPDPDSEAYNTVPTGAYFRILGASDSRYRVYYNGDRARRRPGEAWLDKGHLKPIDWPQFVQARVETPLWREPATRSGAVAHAPRASYLEVLQAGTNDWARVLYLGDGRDTGPYLGWVTAADLVPTDVDPSRIRRFAATAAALARAPEVWLKVPYRSQLDGTPWAAANCGPVSVAMILEAHGIRAQSTEVRRHVMALQNTPNCSECGSFIESLAGAVEVYGLQAVDLTGGDGKLRRWSMDDVRAALRSGHPVIPQVMYRQLPGREDAPYWGDHYVVLTGIVGDYFLYNDPIDDGPGYGRLIHTDQLQRAMATSDFPMAAFATRAR